MKRTLFVAGSWSSRPWCTRGWRGGLRCGARRRSRPERCGSASSTTLPTRRAGRDEIHRASPWKRWRKPRAAPGGGRLSGRRSLPVRTSLLATGERRPVAARYRPWHRAAEEVLSEGAPWLQSQHVLVLRDGRRLPGGPISPSLSGRGENTGCGKAPAAPARSATERRRGLSCMPRDGSAARAPVRGGGGRRVSWSRGWRALAVLREPGRPRVRLDRAAGAAAAGQPSARSRCDVRGVGRRRRHPARDLAHGERRHAGRAVRPALLL